MTNGKALCLLRSVAGFSGMYYCDFCCVAKNKVVRTPAISQKVCKAAGIIACVSPKRQLVWLTHLNKSIMLQVCQELAKNQRFVLWHS